MIVESNYELILSNSTYICRDLIAFLSVDFKTSPVSNVTNFEISDNNLTVMNNINGGESEYKTTVNSDYKFSVIFGTIDKVSATNPRSAIWNIGASSSLFIAIIYFESFIPTWCWVAPEIPQAM